MSTDLILLLFFFNDTATTEIYTLSLHDAFPILGLTDGAARHRHHPDVQLEHGPAVLDRQRPRSEDRKSTRLNSSHANISYAVFCLKKKIKDLHCSYSGVYSVCFKRYCSLQLFYS